jgi:hypothetical protein
MGAAYWESGGDVAGRSREPVESYGICSRISTVPMSAGIRAKDWRCTQAEIRNVRRVRCCRCGGYGAEIRNKAENWSRERRCSKRSSERAEFPSDLRSRDIRSRKVVGFAPRRCDKSSARGWTGDSLRINGAGRLITALSEILATRRFFVD